MLSIESLRSANWNQISAVCLSAYLLGCFTAGYYLVRLRTGLDIRTIGSGSVGARNVSRVLGIGGFFFTLLFDFGKGALAMWLARHFTGSERMAALAIVMVVAGHIWPVPLRFHGGKGMATALGGLVFFDPQLTVVFVVLFLCLFALLRKTVLPGLFAMVCVPAAAVFLDRDYVDVAFLCCLAGLVLIAHRTNIVEEISQLISPRDVQPKPGQPRL